MTGYVCICIDAQRDGSTYSGSGTASVHSPDGGLVHSTRAEVKAVQQASSPTATVPKVAVLAGVRAAQADADRRVAVEVMAALLEAGFCRWFVPESFGGKPRTYTELTRAVVEIGEECAATAWLASLFAYSTRYLACLPEAGQGEVWENGPDARVVSVVKPLGSAVPVEGGWRLSGSWTYASGVEFSDWALLAGPGPADKTQRPLFFVVPRRDYTFSDTWFSLGMRGTGSHTLTLDDVFVPEHRTVLREHAMQGRGPGANARPVSTLAVNGLTFVAPALGAARGALKAAVNSVAAQPTGPRAAAGQAYQIGFARAAGEIDAAHLLLERVATAADAALTPDLVRRSRRDAALALELLTTAADRLLRVGGTRGQEDGHPVQRFWRDVHSVASHAVVQFEPAALDYTQALIPA
jgi:two-component flavin-dependent monooxygenase